MNGESRAEIVVGVGLRRLGISSSVYHCLTPRQFQANPRCYSMTSSSPGSRVVYDVVVGEGGQILLSWLKSRFYSLGDAKIVLDDQKPGVRISGHWESVLFSLLA